MNTPPAYRIRRLAGRCSNGYGRDSGRLAHAVPSDSHIALCGASYGRRSAGWSEWDDEKITCSRCLEKINKDKQ
jgi:hypothetical protein